MWKRILGYSVLGVVGTAGAAASYLYLREPDSRPPSDIKVAMTQDRIARGAYLYRLGDCQGCHTQHEITAGVMKLVGREGAGQIFDAGEHTMVIPNITPDRETGLGTWTDGEKIRAIREGVDKHGRALFPMMPYQNYRHMSDEDVQSLVAYLNSLPAVKNKIPDIELPLFLKVMIKGAPRPVDGPVKTPDGSNRRLAGEYLATLGACELCHTPFDGGSMDRSKRLAGGHRWEFGGNVIQSANITPDPATGIGNWTVDYFKARFHRYRAGVPADAAGKFTLMPWSNLAQLSDEDLELIFEYLRAQPAIEHKVDTYPAAGTHMARKN